MTRLCRRRMTTPSGGNLSARSEDGIQITPAQIDKGALTPDDIMLIRPDGSVEGRHRPSSETPFHTRIYARRPDIGGVVHAHPGGLVTFAICRRSPDLRVLPPIHRICGDVAYTAYELTGTDTLADVVADAFADGFNCAMLENHAAVVGGETLAGAFARFEALEWGARVLIRAGTLGGLAPAPSAEAWCDDGGLPDTTDAENQPDEREALACFTRRAYEQWLFASCLGTLSTRFDDESMMLVRPDADRGALLASDIVVMPIESARHGPSEVALHAAVYSAHPDIHACCTATPINTAAFAISSEPLDTRLIPESYLLLRDVPSIAAIVHRSEPDAVAAQLSARRPVALLRHQGAIAIGDSPLQAFDRMEVLEASAASLISARSVGPVEPMSDASLRELNEMFFGDPDA
jgi:L-fuculose-phosphate aldolase